MTESINPLGTKQHFGNGLAEGSWKGMKKYLEKEMLCDALKNRVVYGFTWYPKFGGLSRVFSVSLDGSIIKKFGLAYAWKMLTQKGMSIRYIDDVQFIPFNERDEYTGRDFADALREYRNQSIDLSIASGNPIIRMFAIVDRRVGKRRLEKLKDEIPHQPEWLKKLYAARMEAEQILSSEDTAC